MHDYSDHVEEPQDQSDKMAQLAVMARTQLKNEKGVAEAEEELNGEEPEETPIGE